MLDSTRYVNRCENAQEVASHLQEPHTTIHVVDEAEPDELHRPHHDDIDNVIAATMEHGHGGVALVDIRLLSVHVLQVCMQLLIGRMIVGLSNL